MEQQEELAQLRRKYGKLIDAWLSKKPETNKLHAPLTMAKKLFDGDIPLSNQYKVESLKKLLEQIPFIEETIIISDDEIEAEKDNAVPASTSPPRSKIKTALMRPASVYAPSKVTERKIIEVEYKKKNENIKKYDPKEETVKLNNIKEKIYARNYLHIIQKEKEEEEKKKQLEEEAKAKEEKKKLKVVKPKKPTMTKAKDRKKEKEKPAEKTRTLRVVVRKLSEDETLLVPLD